MANFEQLQQRTRVNELIDYCKDKEGNNLVIEVVNFAKPLETQSKSMEAAVLISYEDKKPYCIELYEGYITYDSMIGAIENIKKEPSKFKNQ